MEIKITILKVIPILLILIFFKQVLLRCYLYVIMIALIMFILFRIIFLPYEELVSVMCDVIKIRLKRSIASRSGKGNQPLNIKTAVERLILNLG